MANGGPITRSPVISFSRSVVAKNNTRTWWTLVTPPVSRSLLVRSDIGAMILPPHSRRRLIGFSRSPDVVFNHMTGTDNGVGVAGSSTSQFRKKPLVCILTIATQVSRTTITLESISTKISITAVLPEMTSTTGTAVSNSRTASFLTSPSTSHLL